MEKKYIAEAMKHNTHKETCIFRFQHVPNAKHMDHIRWASEITW